MSPLSSSQETGGNPTPWSRHGETRNKKLSIESHSFLDSLSSFSIKCFMHCDVPIKAGAACRPANHMIQQTQRSSQWSCTHIEEETVQACGNLGSPHVIFLLPHIMILSQQTAECALKRTHTSAVTLGFVAGEEKKCNPCLPSWHLSEEILS